MPWMEVIAQIGYDSERDTENPTGSVFCAHGAGFVVPWDSVPSYMHLPAYFSEKEALDMEEWTPRQVFPESLAARGTASEEVWIGTEEIDRILAQTYNANKRDKSVPAKNSWKPRGHGTDVTTSSVTRSYQPKQATKEYLLVDGYNIIFAWEELSKLAEVNIDSARGKLLDTLCNYQGIRGCELIVVFDAYRVAGHQTEIFDYHNIHVVYTKEAETADQYIEKFAHENAKKYRVTVATSDGLEQIIIRGAGCLLLSARDLEQEIREKNQQLMQDYQDRKEKSRNYLLDDVPDEVLRELKEV